MGRWEGEFYEPQEWRNDYPNPAFVRMTDRDAFWATKIIMTFTPEELRAIVEAGEFTNSVEEEYFLDVLVQRQRKTAQYYMNRLNPLDEFEVTGNGLNFANLSERHGFAAEGTTYQVQWSVYDNVDDSRRALGEARDQTARTIALPNAPDVTEGRDRFLLAEIHSLHDEHPMWNRRVGVYLRPSGGTFEVVGVERESDPPDNIM